MRRSGALDTAVSATTLLLGVASLAQAHGNVPHQQHTLSWTFDGWVTGPLALSLGWYAAGYLTLRTRSTVAAAHRASAVWFAAGWLVLAAALVTPLHEAGERSFAAHMLEHELLMLVAAPLLVISRPVGIALWALPHEARRWLGRVGQLISVFWQFVTAPLVATLLQAIALWLWHAPRLFDLALAHSGWHVIQHLSFLVSSLLFWWSMLCGRAARGGVGMAIGCLFFTATISGALGALMAFSASPWYAGYASSGLDAFGLSPAEDQQLAGLLMWIPGGVVHAGAGLALLARRLRRSAARESHAVP
jgi:putative membrane protein